MDKECTFRSRLQQLPLDLKQRIGEVSLQKGLRPTTRRDLIIEALSEYNIDFKNVGTGTNRHIIKYDGFVIKIALDKEGVADNKQEWVMSDKLYPHVAMACEISEGGHMLVAEYCPAFSTFFEMSTHPEIKEILREWSKQYLIGDIGIIDKNYANWGINSNGEAVCIDYAYIFPVGMEVFTCICGCKVMTMDSSFSKYKCTQCSREYSDAELRMTISQSERLSMFNDTPGLKMHNPIETHVIHNYMPDNSERPMHPEYPAEYDVMDIYANFMRNDGYMI